MSSLKVKPCPFCGGDARAGNASAVAKRVFCKCGAQVLVEYPDYWKGTWEEMEDQTLFRAIEKWNRRV